MYRPLTQAVLVQNSIESFAKELKEQIELWKKEESAPSASNNTDFMKLADALEERAFVELKKEVGYGDAKWARGILYAVNCIRSGQLHKI
jgi:hypothetical protein